MYLCAVMYTCVVLYICVVMYTCVVMGCNGATITIQRAI